MNSQYFLVAVTGGRVCKARRRGLPTRWSGWRKSYSRRLKWVLAEGDSVRFVPTALAAQNLKRENVSAERIVITGNTVIDAMLEVTRWIRDEPSLEEHLASQFHFLNPEKKLLLVTGYRRENFGGGLERIRQALTQLAKRGDVEIIYLVHLNPNVRELVRRILADKPSIHLIDHLDYLPFICLMSRAYLILTDSGGIQEEAPSLGKPVLLMSDTTERQEGAEAGIVKLVGTDQQAIIAEVSCLLDDPTAYSQMATAANPYGDGNATARIAAAIMEHQ